MEYSVQSGSNGKEFTFSGRFTFTDQKKVADIQNSLGEERNLQQCVFDLSGVDFIDSSGLGMLLTLQKKGSEQGAEIILRHPQDKVMKVFRACKFETLFVIEE